MREKYARQNTHDSDGVTKGSAAGECSPVFGIHSTGVPVGQHNRAVADTEHHHLLNIAMYKKPARWKQCTFRIRVKHVRSGVHVNLPRFFT